MEKPTLAVLFGGASPEYDVSLQSAHAVITHLDPERYNLVLVGITRDGEWLRYNGPVGKIYKDTWHRPEHCTPAFISPCREMHGLVEYRENRWCYVTPLSAALPVMHGRFGEDGTLQGLLELAGIPVVGCGTLASALCMDKARAHQLAQAAGVAVPRAEVFEKDAPAGALNRAGRALGYPLFVKPVKAGSSFGISRVAAPEELGAAVERARRFDDEILLEEAVEGFEVGCAVLGNDELLIAGPDEIELTEGFFDFTEKYNLVTSQIHLPARLDMKMTERVRCTASTVYRALGCRGFARVDLFVTPQGNILFNEVNTIPGFTRHSRYPNMMQAIGLDYKTLLERLVETALPAEKAPADAPVARRPRRPATHLEGVK